MPRTEHSLGSIFQPFPPIRVSSTDTIGTGPVDDENSDVREVDMNQKPTRFIFEDEPDPDIIFDPKTGGLDQPGE